MQAKPKWLEDIQNNSWNPELLISGGILFSLFQIPDFLHHWGILLLQKSGYFESLVIARILTIAVNGLIVGFTLHLIIRGFWVSAVCLSYVFPKGIRREKLENYEPIFKKKLQQIPDTVDFVILLETISSLIFALSFLFVLVLLSLFTTLMILVPHSSLAEQIGAGMFFVLRIGSGIVLFLAFLYLVDFVTLGRLKKIKGFDKFYYPIYTFFSWLSLAPIYRSAYYTLVTNIKTWKLIVVILIYAVLALVYTASKHPENEDFIYYKKYLASHVAYAVHQPNYYENLRPKTQLIRGASIQSDMISGKLLRIFVVHHKIFERITEINCGEINLQKTHQTEISACLDCLSKLYKIKIDARKINGLKWRIHEHPMTKEIGLITAIPIEQLTLGEHQIHIQINCSESQKKVLTRYGLKDENFVQIPFWKE